MYSFLRIPVLSHEVMEKRSCHAIWCIIIFILLELVNCQNFVGDSCTLQNGRAGHCQILTNCPSALQALQSQGVFPQICGFQGTESIICCAGASLKPTPGPTRPTPTVTQVTPKPTPITKPPTVLLVGDKSRAKCKEYVKHVYERVIPGAPPTADCVIVDVPLIVGGENAKSKEFPHMALIGFDDENNEKTWQCGGTLISDQFVLTAAHCLSAKQFGDAKYIRIGELVLNSNVDDAEPQDFTIIQSFKHPDYAPPSQYNDIALIKMNRKARLNPYARPACLDTTRIPELTRKPVATGWGKVGFNSETSQSLMKVTLEYFTHAECNYSYRNNLGQRLRNGILERTQLCAGSHDESKDTCQGDSGGPLQVVSKEEFCMYRIIGVTSFGKACGIAKVPAVYTRVSTYIGWIEGIVWP